MTPRMGSLWGFNLEEIASYRLPIVKTFSTGCQSAFISAWVIQIILFAFAAITLAIARYVVAYLALRVPGIYFFGIFYRTSQHLCLAYSAIMLWLDIRLDSLSNLGK